MNKPESHGATEIEALSGLTSRIIGAAIEVHKVLGPGLLESHTGVRSPGTHVSPTRRQTLFAVVWVSVDPSTRAPTGSAGRSCDSL
jgi:hypothetical protein